MASRASLSAGLTEANIREQLDLSRTPGRSLPVVLFEKRCGRRGDTAMAYSGFPAALPEWWLHGGAPSRRSGEFLFGPMAGRGCTEASSFVRIE